MPDRDFGMWVDRLAHADESWRRHGLHEQSAPMDSSVKLAFDAYRGDMWGAQGLAGWGGLAPQDLVTHPIFWQSINTLIAQLYARHPYVDVISENPAGLKNARVMERLENHLLRKRSLKIKRTVDRSLLDAILSPFGVIRHGFTPRNEKRDKDGKLLEFYDPAKPDFPWVRRWAPWEVRFDPLAETFDPDGTARWAAFRSLHFMDDLRRNPGFINRQDLRPTHSLKDFTFREFHDNPRVPPQEDAEVVEVWTIYNKKDRTWFAISPNGADKPLRNPEPWPIPWESLPYNILIFNEQSDDPFGISYASQLLPLAIELNKILTIINVAAKSTRRVIPYLGEALEDETKKLLNRPRFQEFIGIKSNAGDIRNVLGQIQVGGLPQELLLYSQFLVEQIRGILGVSEMDRASRINVETATEAAQVQSGSLTQRGRNMGPFEDFLSDTMATFGLALQNTVTDRFAIPILGDDAESLFAGEIARAAPALSPFLTVGPQEIAGEFVYSVRPGSTAPRDPAQDFREEVALNGALAGLPQLAALTNWPNRAVKTVTAAGRVPQDEIQSAALQQATEQNLQQQGLSQFAPSDGQDQGGAGGIDANLAALIGDGGVA